MSLGQFVLAHWKEIGGAISTLLFLASEYLGQSKKIEANNVAQLLIPSLKKEDK